MEPMLAQDWFMPQLCISPSLFILANEYNCYGIFYLFLEKIKIILGYAQSPSSSINRHLKTTLAKDIGQCQHIDQVIHKAPRERPTFKFKVLSVKNKH